MLLKKILNFNGINNVCEIATTIDDSFGESFDKTAKMLGLGYPGGPIIEKLAKKGKEIVPLPLPLKNSPHIAFSYSGIKNAIRLAIKSGKYKKEDIAASFQKKAIEHLTFMCNRVFKKYHVENFAIVGGASANMHLRDEFEKLSKKYSFKLFYPELKYTSDNAAMIARAAIEMYKNNMLMDYKDIMISVFITTPTKETLEERLRLRDSETEEKIQERLSNAKHEMENLPFYDFVIINDSLQKAQKQIVKIANLLPLRPSKEFTKELIEIWAL